MALGELGLERAEIGGAEVAELVDEARQGSPDGGWGELVEMGGNGSPRALDRELDQEGSNREAKDRLRADPEGNHGKRQEGRRGYGFPAPDRLGEAPEDDASRDRPQAVDHGDLR